MATYGDRFNSFMSRQRSGSALSVSRPTASVRGSGGTNFYSRVSNRQASLVERVNVTQILDKFAGGAAGVVGYASRLPAQIVETPFSMVGEALERTPLRGATDALGRSPVGGFLGGLGRFVDTVSNVPAALLNKGDMEIMRRYGNMSDDFVIPGDFMGPGFGEVVDDPNDWAPGFLGMLGIGRQKTMGELRAELRTRGFSDEDFDNVRTGRTSTYDYGDRATNDSIVVDLAGRMVLDPFNLVFFGAGGIASKLARAGSTTLLGRAYGRTRSAFNVLNRRKPTVALPEAVQAAKAGDMSRTTIQGVAEYLQTGLARDLAAATRTAVNLRTRQGLATAVKGTVKFFGDPRGYMTRKGYLKRASALYGLNLTGSILPFEDPLSTQIKAYSQGVLQNQPFSTNSAFLLSTAAFSPMVPAAREAVADGAQVLRASGVYATMPSEIGRLFGRDFDTWKRDMGGEEAANLAILRHAGEVVLDKIKDTPIASAFEELHSKSNRLHAVLDPMIRDLAIKNIEAGKITARDIANRMEKSITRPDIPGWEDGSPLDFMWNGDLYIDTHRQWQGVLNDVSRAMHGQSDFAVGMRQIFSKEDIDLMAKHIELRPGDTMTAKEFDAWLFDKRALLGMERNELPRLFLKAKADGQVTHAEIQDILTKIRNNPITPDMADLYHAERRVEIEGLLATPIRPMYAMDDLRTQMAALKDQNGNVLEGYETRYDFLKQRFDHALSRRVRGGMRRSRAGRTEVQNALAAEAAQMRAQGLNDLADRTIAAMNQMSEGVKPLRRDVAEITSKHVTRIREYTQANGGATFNPYTRRFIEGKGYAVAVPDKAETYALVDPADELAFFEAVTGITREYPGHMIGTWTDPSGQIGLDPVRVFDSENQAKIYATRYDQQGYFDMERGVSVKRAENLSVEPGTSQQFLDEAMSRQSLGGEEGYVYHATRRQNLESIQTQGVTPRGGQSYWSGMDGGTAYTAFGDLLLRQRTPAAWSQNMGIR